MEIRLYFQMLRRGWWIILLTALAALKTSLTVSYLATPQYQAVAYFIITPSSIQTTGPDLILQGLNTIENQTVTTTYAGVMTSTRIYDAAAAFLELKPRDLQDYTRKAQVLPNSSILELSVTGPDPQLAAKLANAIGYQTIDFIHRLNQVINIDFLDTAVPPSIPSSPQPLRDISLALLLGVIVGSGITILSEQLRFSLDTLRHRVHLDNITGVYNNRYFSRLLEEEINKSPKDVLSIGIVELNGLQDILETFPVASIQQILQRATATLRKELRGNDVIGRWNDTSFVVMLPNTPGMAACGTFDRIFQALSEPVNLGQFGATVNLEAHIGGAEYSNGISAQELFAKANSALEQARRNTANPVYVWEIKTPFWVEGETTNGMQAAWQDGHKRRKHV